MALLVGLPESALVDKLGVFLSWHHPTWYSMFIYHLGDKTIGLLVAAVWRHSQPHQHDHHVLLSQSYIFGSSADLQRVRREIYRDLTGEWTQGALKEIPVSYPETSKSAIIGTSHTQAVQCPYFIISRLYPHARNYSSTKVCDSESLNHNC
jgi:hypothetical protein